MNKKFIYLAIAATLAMPQLLQAQNVGIGTTTPAATLDVNGNVKISGGAPGAGKVLTSDANGVAAWMPTIQPGYMLSDNATDAGLIANNYNKIATTLFETKTPQTLAAVPESWMKSSHFLGPRINPVVINGSGNNFIVFGGYDENNIRTDGAIYDANADTWTQIPDMDDGLERRDPTVVWAGSKLLVWGGTKFLSPDVYYNSGAIYNPINQTWTPMSMVGAPAGRILAASAYNAPTNELAIWGGDGATSNLADGAKYNLTTNTWTTMSTVNAPSGRSRMGYTGNNAGKLFIYGGYFALNNYSTSVHLYDFSSNSWSSLPSSGLNGRHSSRVYAVAGKYIVWGDNFDVNDGAVYNVGTNNWTLMSTVGAPLYSFCRTAISNGYMVAVGHLGCAKYNYTTNVWTSLPLELRAQHGVAATNTCVFTWGGKRDLNPNSPYVPEGKRFFWSALPITTHTSGALELHLYKKN